MHTRIYCDIQNTHNVRYCRWRGTNGCKGTLQDNRPRNIKPPFILNSLKIYPQNSLQQDNDTDSWHPHKLHRGYRHRGHGYTAPQPALRETRQHWWSKHTHRRRRLNQYMCVWVNRLAPRDMESSSTCLPSTAHWHVKNIPRKMSLHRERTFQSVF